MPMVTNLILVVPYIGTWIETIGKTVTLHVASVVPYIGTWIETTLFRKSRKATSVVPYIGTWIETVFCDEESVVMGSYLI